MATNAQRWQAFCDALVNRTATAAEQDALGEALYARTEAEWALLTSTQKLAEALKLARRWANSTIKNYKDEQAKAAVVPVDPNQLPEA